MRMSSLEGVGHQGMPHLKAHYPQTSARPLVIESCQEARVYIQTMMILATKKKVGTSLNGRYAETSTWPGLRRTREEDS